MQDELKKIFDEQIPHISHPTPFFVYNAKAVMTNFEKFKTCVPEHTEICYAMKANSETPVLETLRDIGSSFEVASKYELDFLKKAGVHAERIIYGTAVKPADHIEEFVRYGVNRFAFDSEPELLKLATHAPGSRVYIRMNMEVDSDSVFHMSEKFGISVEKGIELLIKAKELGLVPYGISFNSGSQARKKDAWRRGIESAGMAMKTLLEKGIEIKMINIGGGFPQAYTSSAIVPSIEEISAEMEEGIKTLPYKVGFIAEPGRALVANAFALVTSIILRNRRIGGDWLYLDAGVYNALLESLRDQGNIRYSVSLFKNKANGKDTSPADTSFILAGPTGDDIDTIDTNALLPSTADVGDRVIFYDTGAYTFVLATEFNGFPKPPLISLLSAQE